MEEHHPQLNVKLILEKILEATELVNSRMKNLRATLKLQNAASTSLDESTSQKATEEDGINNKVDFKDCQLQYTQNSDTQILTSLKDFTTTTTTETQQSNAKMERAEELHTQYTEILDNPDDPKTTTTLNMTFHPNQPKPEEQEDQPERMINALTQIWRSKPFGQQFNDCEGTGFLDRLMIGWSPLIQMIYAGMKGEPLEDLKAFLWKLAWHKRKARVRLKMVFFM